MFRVRTEVAGVDYRNICGSPEQFPILEQNGQGVGIIDFDGDGLIDLFVPNGSTESRWRAGRNPGSKLFRNLGNWRFVDVTEEAGVKGNAWSCGVAISDYDADGDFDIYVLNWGPNVLYRNNGDSTFTDVTRTAGVGDPRWSSSAAFADFNGDGLLDIYVSNYVKFDFDDYPRKEKDGSPCRYRGVDTGCGPWCYEGESDSLYINIGQGRFEERSTQFGLGITRGFRGFGVVASDFDADGDADLYVGCDVMPNLYLINTGSGMFRSAGSIRGGTLNAEGKYESGMGVAVADFDRSGTLDLFITNFAGEKNTFYRNRGGSLYDESSAVGFDSHRPEMGWGIAAQDFDQDGLVDIFIANGQIYPQVKQLNDPLDGYSQSPRFYRRRSRGDLEEVKTDIAFSKPVRLCLRGCATADIDNDGDIDIVAVQHNGPLVFFQNLSDRPSVMLELEGTGGGRSPVGARVKASDGSTHWLCPNQGYQSSNDHRIQIAPITSDPRIDLDVHWPNGYKERFSVEKISHSATRLRQGLGRRSGSKRSGD